jgi:methionine-rich copper-binding protein CopC
VKRFTFLVCLLALFAVIGPALAHSELTDSHPAPGAQLAESPAEIQLTFSEPVTAGSRIVVLAEGFQSVGGVEAQVDTLNPAVIRAPLPDLEPGAYTVQWTASSADGHEISGSYTFSVGEAAGDASQGEADTPSTAEGLSTPGSNTLWWVALIVGGVLITLLILYRSIRR